VAGELHLCEIVDEEVELGGLGAQTLLNQPGQQIHVSVLQFNT